MQRQNTPTVAVVIPVFAAEFLSDCVASVFTQTRAPDQVVVVDDGSPDGDAVERALAAFRNRITLIRQPNRGAGAARNAGVLAAATDLVAFLDADDRWYPPFLNDQLDRLEATRDCTVVHTNARMVGHTPLAGTLFMEGASSRGEVTVESLLDQRCTVLTSSVVVRRQALLDAGLFDANLRRGQDFDLWVRLAHRGARFAYTTTPLVERRVHGHNLSGGRVAELERALAVLRALSTKLASLRGNAASSTPGQHACGGGSARSTANGASRRAASWQPGTPFATLPG